MGGGKRGKGEEGIDKSPWIGGEMNVEEKNREVRGCRLGYVK